MPFIQASCEFNLLITPFFQPLKRISVVLLDLKWLHFYILLLTMAKEKHTIDDADDVVKH